MGVQSLSTLATQATYASRVGVARVGWVKSYTPHNIRIQYGRSRVPFMHQDSRPWQ